MAKVIFEFNNTGNVVNMNVRLEESSPEDQIGPHDVMAGIIKSMAPEIIKKATEELLKSARELGPEVEGKLFSYNPNTARH